MGVWWQIGRTGGQQRGQFTDRGKGKRGWWEKMEETGLWKAENARFHRIRKMRNKLSVRDTRSVISFHDEQSSDKHQFLKKKKGVLQG